MTLASVIFDLDDTLYSELDFVRSGFESVGAWWHAEFAIQGIEALAWTKFHAGCRERVFDEIVREMPVESYRDELVQKMVSIYRMHSPRITLPRDSVDCLKQLGPMFKLGLITDGNSGTQWNKVRALGLDRILDEVIVTSDLGRDCGKPDRRAFVEMERRLSLKGPELVYVADNPVKDFTAPNLLGWHTVQLHRQGGLYGSLPGDSAPGQHIDDLTELLPILEDLTSPSIASVPS